MSVWPLLSGEDTTYLFSFTGVHSSEELCPGIKYTQSLTHNSLKGFRWWHLGLLSWWNFGLWIDSVIVWDFWGLRTEWIYFVCGMDVNLWRPEVRLCRQNNTQQRCPCWSVVSHSLWPHGLQHCQVSLSFTNSQSLLKFMSIESVMPSNHLILCRPLLLLPSIFPSIRVFPMSQFFASDVQTYWCYGLNQLLSLQFICGKP